MTKQEKAAAKRYRRAHQRKGPGYMRESFSWYGTWNARPEGERVRERWNKSKKAKEDG